MIERLVDRWVGLAPHTRLFIIIFAASMLFLTALGVTRETPIWTVIVAASWAAGGAAMLWLSNKLKARQRSGRRRR